MGERQFTSRGPFAVTESDCKHASCRLRINAVADDRGFVALEASGSDDEHSSRRRARDRCIAGAVRESVQLEVGVEVQQRCFQRQSISRGRAIRCLPTFAWMTWSKRRCTQIARRGRSMGATVRGCHTPRRCNLESRRPPARHVTRGSPRRGAPAPAGADDRFDDSRHPPSDARLPTDCDRREPAPCRSGEGFVWALASRALRSPASPTFQTGSERTCFCTATVAADRATGPPSGDEQVRGAMRVETRIGVRAGTRVPRVS